MELDLLEGLPHNGEDLRDDLLIALADLALVFLRSDQLLILRELVLHLLGLEQVDVLLEEQADRLQDLVHSGGLLRDYCLVHHPRVKPQAQSGRRSVQF